MNKQINTLLKKEMTRKEFVATLGFGAASVLGLSSILRMAGLRSPLHRHINMGYGGSAYGGGKD